MLSKRQVNLVGITAPIFTKAQVAQTGILAQLGPKWQRYTKGYSLLWKSQRDFMRKRVHMPDIIYTFQHPLSNTYIDCTYNYSSYFPHVVHIQKLQYLHIEVHPKKSP